MAAPQGGRLKIGGIHGGGYPLLPPIATYRSFLPPIATYRSFLPPIATYFYQSCLAAITDLLHCKPRTYDASPPHDGQAAGVRVRGWVFARPLPPHPQPLSPRRRGERGAGRLLEQLLSLEEAEEGGSIVTSPLDPELITQAEKKALRPLTSLQENRPPTVASVIRT